jgi:hypothetical protein
LHTFEIGISTDGDYAECNGLLEIKYFAASAGQPLSEAVKHQGCILRCSKNGKFSVKEKHKYFDQMQLQMAVTGI